MMIGIKMKCPSCGYIKERKTETVDEVIRFKSGPRKGEIKEVKSREIELAIGDEDFRELEILTGISRGYCNYYSDEPTKTGLNFNTIDVLVCPKCKTMILNED